jgi:hypothetical protein
MPAPLKLSNAPRLRRAVGAAVALAVLLNLVATPFQPTAHAWKPVTHVYLAEVARADALDDGMVTIPLVDYETGKIIGTIGSYRVGQETLNALRQHPDQFRAGVIGPDAYPDIMTGQQLIHPDGRPGGPTSNDWLEYLWDSSQKPPYATAPVRAFVLGFLAHAAGDMYGHTFINHYTGGNFELGENAAKHIVLEGYIGKRTPPPSSYDFSIAGVEDFIYKQMVDARPGSMLEGKLLTGDSATYSVPYLFSTLRNNLQRDIDGYDGKISDYNRRIDEKKTAADKCKLTDLSCSAAALLTEAGALELEKQGYIARNGAGRAYKVKWRDDIDSGLSAWPELSHEIARALTYNPGGADVDAASEAANGYVEDHLISMMGAPDVGVELLANLADILSVVPGAKEAFEEMARDLFDYLLEKATGLTVDEAKGYLTSPERYFDALMGQGAGEYTSLAQINALMRLDDPGYSNPDERFDYREFPAAYNTVIMIKLLLMEPSEVNRLLKDLGSSDRLPERAPGGLLGSLIAQVNRFLSTLRASNRQQGRPNAALGFIRTLDGGNEWHNHAEKLVLATDMAAYRQVFMKQPGEQPDR